MRVFLFDWDKEGAPTRAAALRQAGFHVEVESENGARGVRAVLAHPPDVEVLSLDKHPSHSRETADATRRYRAGRAMPIVFVGGDGAYVENSSLRVPGATFVAPEQLVAALQLLRDSSSA